jgi:hypothetical protein
MAVDLLPIIATIATKLKVEVGNLYFEEPQYCEFIV